MKKPLIKIFLIFAAISAVFLVVFAILSFKLKSELLSAYYNSQSTVIKDRSGEVILVKPNRTGFYAEYADEVPLEFKKLLLGKEDKYFYYHFGINPISNLRAVYNFSRGNKNLASSTITQQLAKILLGWENKRTFANKIIEAAYAVSLETHLEKEEILKMYANSVYFGNKAQGISTASKLYFDVSPSMLTEFQTVQLLAAIPSPSTNNPFTVGNIKSSEMLAEKLGAKIEKQETLSENEIREKRGTFKKYTEDDSYFELGSLKIDCRANCNLTIDKELSGKLREILKRNISSILDKNVTNGSIIAIKLPDRELLAIIGSPDPKIRSYGYQINMAAKPRPIGSTIKPFVYLKGFEKGLRPYTVVDDKEYRYTIGTGFAFYPKNYDYEYRGEVSLHYSLVNSLNVPSVKVLEYAGLNDFYKFLLEDLQFKPVQNLENYQLGIVLGELEMDLLSLSYYFTAFANDGQLLPLKIYQDEIKFTPKISANLSQNKKISEKEYIQLINKILSDRKMGVEQFGIKSDLDLLQNNYAAKTGTSREFHDSWTIGYTPNFLVGVWVGNSDNTAMDKVSGQSGAGKIWHEAMNLLINSTYNKKTPFDFDLIKEFHEEENIEYGLKTDSYEKQKNLLKTQNLILNPHNYDVFLLEKNSEIYLRANEVVKWYINDKFLSEDEETIFKPENIGSQSIKAINKNGREEIIKIYLEKNND